MVTFELPFSPNDWLTPYPFSDTTQWLFTQPVQGGNMLTIILGFLAALIMQWAKTTPAIPWITPEHTKTLQAILAIFSALVGIVVAAQQPGGLAQVNWEVTLRVLFENAATVYGAAVITYVGLVKPNAK